MLENTNNQNEWMSQVGKICNNTNNNLRHLPILASGERQCQASTQQMSCTTTSKLMGEARCCRCVLGAVGVCLVVACVVLAVLAYALLSRDDLDDNTPTDLQTYNRFEWFIIGSWWCLVLGATAALLAVSQRITERDGTTRAQSVAHSVLLKVLQKKQSDHHLS